VLLDYENIWENGRKGAIKYISSLSTGNQWEIRVSKAAEQPIAMGTATAVLLLQFLDALKIIDTDRDKWINHISSFQRDDGLFEDKIDIANPTQKQPLWALLAHRTRHCSWAIEALGGKLKRPIKFVESFKSRDSMQKWMQELWSQNWTGGFWAAGNWIMDMGVLLDLQFRHFQDEQASEAIQFLFDYLDKKQDPATGFWFGPNDDIRCAMAGAMHLYPLYLAYNRPINYFEQIIDNTLALQQSDGLFDYEVGKGGSQCLDFDAMVIISNGYFLLPEKQQQIKECSKKVLDAIMVNKQADGSFSDSRIDQLRFWSTQAAAFKSNEGSIWDTYARIMTIAMCIEILKDAPPSPMRGENHLFEIWHGGKGWNKGFNPHA